MQKSGGASAAPPFLFERRKLSNPVWMVNAPKPPLLKLPQLFAGQMGAAIEKIVEVGQNQFPMREL